MKKVIGKAGKVTISTSKPKDYFNRILKRSKKAREGYIEEESMFNLVEKVKAEMEKKHLSQYALAKKAGIKYQVVSRILNGAPNAEVNTLSRIGNTVNLKLTFAKK